MALLSCLALEERCCSCTLSLVLLSSSSRPEAVEAAIRTFTKKSNSLSKSADPDHLIRKVSFFRLELSLKKSSHPTTTV